MATTITTRPPRSTLLILLLLFISEHATNFPLSYKLVKCLFPCHPLHPLTSILRPSSHYRLPFLSPLVHILFSWTSLLPVFPPNNGRLNIIQSNDSFSLIPASTFFLRQRIFYLSLFITYNFPVLYAKCYPGPIAPISCFSWNVISSHYLLSR